jgi:hypothetical protein
MADDKDTNETGSGTSAPSTGASAQSSLDTEAARADRDDQRTRSAERGAEVREELTKPADIGAAGSAKGNMDASGAIMEPSVKSDIDVDHPAVDNNPRAGTTDRQNRIDFNDPNLKDRQAVEQNLSDQS